MAGSGFLPKWPTGRGATGNEGVATLVKESSGSIGCVVFIYALQNHLSYGRIRNQNGEFVDASLESISSAVASAEIHDDLKASLVDALGVGVYPIASFTWIVVPTHIADDESGVQLQPSSSGCSGPASGKLRRSAISLLPKDIVAKEEDAVARIH